MIFDLQAGIAITSQPFTECAYNQPPAQYNAPILKILVKHTVRTCIPAWNFLQFLALPPILWN